MGLPVMGIPYAPKTIRRSTNDVATNDNNINFANPELGASVVALLNHQLFMEVIMKTYKSPQ